MPESGVPSPLIGLLDYGSGNLHSALKALQATGARVVLGGAEEVSECDGLVVPGVGAFAACMDALVAAGGEQLIRQRVQAGHPVLGICVGHQVMFTEGTERGSTRAGVGVLPGSVGRLRSRRLPHMGWNTVEPGEGSVLFTQPSERFYFVHSYGVRSVPEDLGAVVTWAEHDGDRFVAAVESDPLTSVQFHPEKSGAAGARLLSRWVETVAARLG